MQRNSKDYQRARRLLESFTERPLRREQSVRLPAPPKIGVAFGRVIGIMYQTPDGESFIHRFRLQESRPLIVSSPDGKQLFLIGGSYNFTERGIVDVPRRKNGGKQRSR